MALREDQVVRYSRQILLKEVGGRGQQALLEAGVRLEGSGPAGLTAAAYLAAGGTAVEASRARLGPGAAGFLVSEEEVGQEAASVLERVLPRVNGDAVGARAGGRLAELPATWAGEGPWVALGGDGRRGAVVFRGRGGCMWCFGAAVRGLQGPPTGMLGLALGALGALVYQRLLLGLEPTLGGRWLEAPGRLEPWGLPPCGQCRSPLPATEG